MALDGTPRSSFRTSLEEHEWRALLDRGHLRQWDRGDMIIRAGDPAESAIVLLDGLVKVHRLSVAGGDVVLAVSGPGDLLGEFSAVSDDAVRSAHVTALEPVSGAAIAVADLRQFLADHPRAAMALLRLALVRLQEANTRRLEFATSESLARVASRLVELAERFGTAAEGGAVEVKLPITQEELGSWSASSRESTARALRTLRDLGLVETSRLRLRIRDLDGLRRHEARL